MGDVQILEAISTAGPWREHPQRLFVVTLGVDDWTTALGSGQKFRRHDAIARCPANDVHAVPHGFVAEIYRRTTNLDRRPVTDGGTVFIEGAYGELGLEDVLH